MKFLVIFVFLLGASTACVWAQENPTEPTGDNEIKVNGAYLLGGFAEITYERILGEDSAIGVSMGFALDNSIDYRFGVIPYYRLYFGKKKAAGFFVEGNGAFYSGRDFSSDTEFGAGLGLAIGGKFITQKGWIAELLIGLGRNFVSNDELNEIYPRTGILIGKRF
jgi:hypothetical protein